MLRPDLSGDAFLRRHQNPVGIALRGLCLLILLYALWTHRPGLILFIVMIDAANWLYCPEDPTPPEWLEQLLDMEFAFLDLPPSGIKLALTGAVGFGGAMLCLGLWAHHFGTILVALVAIGAFGLALRWIATR